MIMIKKKFKLIAMSILILALNIGCNQFLEVDSLTRVNSEILLSSEKGLKTILANLYNRMPLEDFNYRPDVGFNLRGWGGGAGEMVMTSMYTDESILSQGNGIGLGGYNYWTRGFETNREVNIFLNSIKSAFDGGIISEAVYNRLWSEAHFIRAYVYFGLAKRFGGVPIIDWLQDDDYTGDAEVLKVPRSTELDTWKFILAECDKAIEYLPTPDEFSDNDGNPLYRATRWTAYALKSRVALHAASIAKYSSEASFTGEAVNLKLVGMDASDATFFYNECISASNAIIENSNYSLYMPNPANAADAAKNFQELFMNTQGNEIIFAKTYLDGSKYADQGHDYDVRYSPSQASTGFHKWGRFSVALDLVDLYEDYTDDGTGTSALIKTRTDGIENSYFSTNNPPSSQVASIPFIKYGNPYEPFMNKDARLHGSVIVPGGVYKGVTIVMQGGMIKKDGTLVIYQRDQEEGYDGNMYYTYGADAPTNYSGFATMTSADDANYSATGFSVRKYLAEDKTIVGTERSSYTPWIEFRLAEIYLNYAESVAESGQGSQANAQNYLNALRKRAGHTDNIPLTLENVLKERRLELAFENIRIWDLVRRREYHTLYNNFRRKALVQLIDLREPTPKYVFLRMEQFHDVQAGGRTFQVNNYYYNIPGVDVSGLINNPGR